MIAGYNCGTRINTGLLPGYEEGMGGVIVGLKMKFFLTIRNMNGDVAATETNNKMMCGAFLIEEHIPQINLGLF